MKQIEAVIFDWAGTTVDFGCMAPIHAMLDAFRGHKIDVSLDEIRKPMGKLKLDHIKEVLNFPRIKQNFYEMYGRESNESDITNIYKLFENNIFAVLHNHTKLIPHVLEVQHYLRNNNIKIGSTTGYTTAMINVVAESAANQGYCPDVIVASDQVRSGRPFPYMIFRNAEILNVRHIQNVIKVGDTIVDIEEGINAGCTTVGVLNGSSQLGLTEEEFASYPAKELADKLQIAKYAMLNAGAHYVINALNELPAIIELIQNQEKVEVCQ